MKADQETVDMTQETATQQSNGSRVDKDSIRPFRVHVREKQITSLRRRIRETRWPDKGTVADSSQGPQLARLQKLVH